VRKSSGLSWPTRNGLPSTTVIVSISIVVGLLIISAPLAEINPIRIVYSVPRMADFISHLIVMPDWSYIPELSAKMLETIEMTIMATSIALVISLPIGFMAARNTSPHPLVFHFVRSLLSLMRALPELVWALVFVSALGLGPLPGIMALSFVTVGFMGKFFAAGIEVVDYKLVEGVSAHGAGWFQIRTFAYFPHALPDFIGTVLYILDHNLRAATILGMVGAGGIGYDMIMSMRLFDYNRLILIAAGIYVIVTMLDMLSDRIRAKII